MLLTVIKYLGSAIIAGIVSWGVAKIAAKAEIRKLRETWAHEKETAYDADFDNMVAAVSYFARFPSGSTVRSAIEKTAIFRSKASGELATVVDDITNILSRQCTDYSAILRKLDEAVELKRNAKN